MKANELMIGDWVWYDNQPHQIRQLGIFGENRDGDDYPAVCVGKPNGVGLILERNEIKPIPLTPEILEKNGWGKDTYSNESYDNEELECLSLWVGEDGKNKWWWRVGVELVTPINYVHEFQHALRLCGIEKEILL
jgi:hypothetical protein